MARLQQPRQLRLGLSIDDFGTGYSSLAYLKSFPINVLKIDRSFVTDIDQDEENRAITRAIVAMSDAPGARRCG